jgi:hypothetical protein
VAGTQWCDKRTQTEDIWDLENKRRHYLADLLLIYIMNTMEKMNLF